MTTFGLTKRQAQILKFIREHMANDAPAPSYQEIANCTGSKSKGDISRILHALKERGHIDFLPGRARSLILIQSPEPVSASQAAEQAAL